MLFTFDIAIHRGGGSLTIDPMACLDAVRVLPEPQRGTLDDIQSVSLVVFRLHIHYKCTVLAVLSSIQFALCRNVNWTDT